MCCVFRARFWLAIFSLGLVVGMLSFTRSCLTLTDLGGRSKDFTYLKNNNKNWNELAEHKDDTSMLAEMHISSLFLYSILNSHNVMNSQVWWKLQVFVTCRNFAFYLSVTNLFRAVLIILFMPTDSFQATVNHKASLYSKYSVGSGRKLKCPASLETENIHLYCTDEETAFITALLQYHAAISWKLSGTSGG